MSFTRLCLVVAFLVLTIPVSAFSHQLPANFSGFEDPAACGDCHKAIYDEWKSSMHSKSSKVSDPVHAAVHDAFMAAMKASGKTPTYFCAACHTPAASNIDALIKGAAMPDPADPEIARGIPCSFCHKVDGLVEGERFNTYRITDVIKGKSESKTAPHKVEASSFASTQLMCLGCHGKMVNSKGGVVCSMDEEGVSDCLKCHMPDIAGGPAHGSAKETHASHAFPASHDPAMLKSGASVEVGAELGRLVVILKNPNPHFFPSTNPLRVAFLKVVVFDKDGKVLFTNFEKEPSEDPNALLARVFKAGDKVGVPSWEADGVAKDTRLKANEERSLTYKLPAGAAKATAKLFYRFVPPAAIKNFGIKPDGVVEVPQLVSEASIEIKQGALTP